MQIRNQKGFTLIELLVVIAIIGLLSTIAVVALTGARAKARDAKRISDIKQISTILDVEEAAAPLTALTGCVLADALTSTCTNAGDINNSFGAGSGNALCDPKGKCAGTVECSAVGEGVDGCNYSFDVAAPTTAVYKICFFLESQNQYGAAGVYNIIQGGKVASGC